VDWGKSFLYLAVVARSPATLGPSRLHKPGALMRLGIFNAVQVARQKQVRDSAISYQVIDK
jgi:hypothetical protein